MYSTVFLLVKIHILFCIQYNILRSAVEKVEHSKLNWRKPQKKFLQHIRKAYVIMFYWLRWVDGYQYGCE